MTGQRRFGLAVLVAVAVLGAIPAVAGAHAAFQDAVPEPGARLESSPAEIVLAFTEPLSPRLTRATLVDAASGRTVAVSRVVEGRNRLVVRPRGALATAPYRVDWHTVSRLDGHALEGSFGFGVRTAAPGGGARLEQSPLARDGWLRVALRGLLYVALFFFGGGLLVAALLSPRVPAGWLRGGSVGGGREVARRAWRRTRVAGWITTGAAIAVALVETSDAAGSIGPSAIDAYLLSTASGVARTVTVVALAAATLAMGRSARIAALLVSGALLAVALGGHANSASPRAFAVGSDWVHLLAGAVWAGGIAQIALAWLPPVQRLGPENRRAVMRQVLEPFGRLALPAFLLVVGAGVINAAIELGHLRELWSSGYGLALAVKIAVVGLLAAASYIHAVRLRPRLLARGVGGDARSERRHWRLLGLEPGLGAVIVGVAALLAVFPLPPRQLLERAEEGDEGAPARAPLRAPAHGELAVAWHAGPWLAAAWIRPAHAGVDGTVRLFSPNLVAPHATVSVRATSSTTCARACARFRGARGRDLAITVRTRHRRYAVTLPASWRRDGGRAAAELARVATATMRELRSVRVAERLSGGIGLPVTSRYRLRRPDGYVSIVHSRDVTTNVVIGRRSWFRTRGGDWRYEPLGAPFDVRGFFPWNGHVRGARLLSASRRQAVVALADPGGGDLSRPPFWFRLTIDRTTHRVVRMQMTAPGHFMTQRYFAFNRAGTIRAPR